VIEASMFACQNLTYDAVSNLISLTTTQNAAGGKSGGTETSSFRREILLILWKT
jgi:hypothetical protein